MGKRSIRSYQLPIPGNNQDVTVMLRTPFCDQTERAINLRNNMDKSWMNPKCIMPSERIQSEKPTSCMTSFI